MIIPVEIMDAFYEGERCEEYPLAVNDGVRGRNVRKPGELAAAISVQSLAPSVSYRVEHGDGSDEIVPLSALELVEPNQPVQTRPMSRPV